MYVLLAHDIQLPHFRFRQKLDLQPLEPTLQINPRYKHKTAVQEKL